MNNPFKFVGKYNIESILETFNNVTEEDWLEDTERSEKFLVHKDTHMLKILWDIDFFNTKHERNYNLFNFDKIFDDLRIIYEKCYGVGDFEGVLFTRLKPQSGIPSHTDSGPFSMIHRTHIPIITNEKNLFKVGNEVKYLKQGEIWEFDNTLTHVVINMSDEPRIHLIIDYKTGADPFWARRRRQGHRMEKNK